MKQAPVQAVSLDDRILDAARRLVMQTGTRRLSLTEVATLAGVSRPTLYRYFVSKEELVEALGKREYRRFNSVMSTAIAGTNGTARFEAAIDVAAGFLQDQPPRHVIDLDPGFVNDEVARILPMLTEALTEVFQPDLAAAIARTAMSHYIFPDSEASAARRQMRAAAGLPPAS
jgi:TetR/AcrR family transcriptional regulator, repressor for uid operon